MRLQGLFVLSAVVLSGCATQQSALDGKPFTRTDMKLYPVTVSKVNGESRTGNPVMVDAGKHTITLSAAPANGGRVAVERSLSVDVAQCERIVFGARRESPLLNEFTPVIVERYALGGCAAKKT
jgi:hypothetical protein